MIEIKSGLPDYKLNMSETITKTGHAQQLSLNMKYMSTTLKVIGKREEQKENHCSALNKEGTAMQENKVEASNL